MRPANLGAVRLPLLGAAVLALLAAPLSAQMVEKERTFADLTATHPCDSGFSGRNAIVTDCDAADDIGDGEGAFRCFAHCDGTAPWEAVSIGAGGGGLPGADEVTEAMLKATNAATDEYVLTYESTVGDFEWQAAATGTIGGTLTATDDLLTCTDGTGGSTIGACTVGNLDNLRLDGNTISSMDTNGNIGLDPNGNGVSATGSGYVSIHGFTAGISAEANNALYLVSNGVPVLEMYTAVSPMIRSDGQYAFSSSAGVTAATTPDAGFQRVAAGAVVVTNGGAGVGSLLSAVPVEANTAVAAGPNVLAATESRKLLTNEGIAAQNYHTLPTAAAGLCFEFAVQDADGIRIVANTDDTIRIAANASATAGYVQNSTIGSTIKLCAINATEWFAMGTPAGTWTIDS